MENIRFLDVLILMILIPIIYELLKFLSRKKYLGKLLLQVSGGFNSRSSMFLWIFMGCIWMFFLILELLNLNENYAKNPISNLLTPSIWIILCLVNILGIKYDKEIRENGITILQNYVYWSDIIKYKWIENESLEITFRQQIIFNFRKKTTKIWIIDLEDKEKIDTIFNRYVNIEKKHL